MPRVNEEELVFEAFGAEVYETATVFLSANAIGSFAILIALFVLFVVHQFFLWMSTDPVRAFHLAKIVASGVSSVWNTLRVIYNGWVDVVTALMPSINVVGIHVVQPTIFMVLDVVSLVFTGNGYGGIIKDTSGFQGHVCDGSAGSAGWCAVQAKYASDLGAVEAEGSNVIQNGTAIVMSTAQARRLQALTGESLIGTLPIQPLIDVITDIVGVLILFGAQAADIATHVVWTLLHEIAKLLYNLAMLLIRVVGSLVLQVFASGIVQNLFKIGLDILMVLVIHVALPLLLAVLDLIMCIINFAMPGTWPDQLRCGTLALPLFPIPQPCTHAHTHTDNLFPLFSCRSGSYLLPGGRRFGRRNLHHVFQSSRHRKAGRHRSGGPDQPLHRPTIRTSCQRRRVKRHPGQRRQLQLWQRRGKHVCGMLHVPRARAPRPVAPHRHDVGVCQRRDPLRRTCRKQMP